MNMHAEVDDETRINVWRAMRVDDLYAKPKLLVDALYETGDGDLGPSLLAMLVALSTPGKDGGSCLDAIVDQHENAVKAIDAMVTRVIEAEEKRGCWRGFE